MRAKKKKEKSNDQWDEVIHNDINAFHTYSILKMKKRLNATF